MPNCAQYLRGFGRRKPGAWARIDWTHPLTRGLIGCWLFNECGGTTIRDIGKNGVAGTLNSATWTTGNFCSSALNFSSAYVSFGNPTSAQLTTWTVAGWVRPTSLSATQCLVNNGTNTQRNYYLGTNASAGARLYLTQGASNYLGFEGVQALSTNTWYHLAGTYNNATLALYVNGVLDNSASISGAPDVGAGNLFVGSLDGTNELFPGKIDTFLIYNRGLSAGEVKQLYQQPFCFLKQVAPSRGFAAAVAAAAGVGFSRSRAVNSGAPGNTLSRSEIVNVGG